MPAKQQKVGRDGQAARSAAMRARLMSAARQCLIERGYGRSTAVDICALAGVTRGALFHHFAGLPELFEATLDELCTAMLTRAQEKARKAGVDGSLASYVDILWSSFREPEFKIVIEIWLAARNDPELRQALAPVMAKFSMLASPELNSGLAARVGRRAKQRAFHRLVLEAMIGMALGRALSPEGSPLGHEKEVLALLREAARGIEAGRR